MTIHLAHNWTLGRQLDEGGFGRVFEARAPDVERPAVAKLVHKEPGADRELLYVLD